MFDEAGAAPTFAIVGSGPSGCYTAQALRKEWPDAEIVLFDRLPVPYGLVRYGVATDHQGTKAVSRQFDRLFERDGVAFAGTIDVGSDVSLAELHASFDVVVLATGLYADRPLEMPGAHLPGVYGSGALTRYLTDHPHEAGLEPEFGERVVVIGNGNVAVDLVRLLAKPAAAFDGTDIHEAVLDRITSARIRHITVVGRSSAAQAKFDTAMIKELGKLSGVRFTVDAVGIPDDASRESTAKANVLRELAGLDVADPRTEVSFRFGWRPERIEGAASVTHVVFANEAGEYLEVAADSVLSAIGFTGVQGCAEPDTGPTGSQQLYRVGWARRGARGGIPENRKDAKEVAARISDDLRSLGWSSGKPGWAGLPADIRARAVSFAGWRQIDAAETAAASPGRIRRKFLTTHEMCVAARQAGLPPVHENLEGAVR